MRRLLCVYLLCAFAFLGAAGCAAKPEIEKPMVLGPMSNASYLLFSRDLEELEEHSELITRQTHESGYPRRKVG